MKAQGRGPGRERCATLQQESYDLIVIGGGPGGQRAAIQGAKARARVCMIDRRKRLGGVCLHSGTIPSKTLREAVMYLCGLRQTMYYGKPVPPRGDVTLEVLNQRIQKVMTHELDVIETQLRRNKVEILSGTGRFAGPHSIEVYDEEDRQTHALHGEKIVIATGTSPYCPPEVPFDQEVIFDSSFIFAPYNKRSKLPDSLIVVGGGVIGTEYASLFQALGCQVVLTDRRAEPFRFVDPDLGEFLRRSMQRDGMQIHFDIGYRSIERTPEGKARITLDDGQVFEADALLYAMGRSPAIESLHIDGLGIETHGHGEITVNENFQTSLPHVYAVGDVIGHPALASTSGEQGRMAARHALQLEHLAGSDLLPMAIYTIPEISMVGMSETALKQQGQDYAQGVALYGEMAKAAIMGNTTGALKILFNRQTHRVLGVHMVGNYAAELIHLGQFAMQTNARVEFFVNNVFNYPTLAEAYQVAALNGLNQISGSTRPVSLLDGF